MIKLSVNLNKIALIRNSRPGNYPDVIAHARTCLAAGADGITVHPRPDLRHIRPHDVHQLGVLIRDHPRIEFNVEGNPFEASREHYPGLLALVEQTRPHQCTLVPDSTEQLTSNHGFDITVAGNRLRPVVARLQTQGVRVSLFMDPDIEQIELAAQLGVDRIELYTGPYAEHCRKSPARGETLFTRYREAAECALALGLGVNAGHDLNLDNLERFVALPGLREVSIGHALIVDALAMGLTQAVHAYKARLSGRVRM